VIDATVKIHAIETDGVPSGRLPDSRVAFIFDGCIVSGWPVGTDGNGDAIWEGDSDVARGGRFDGVTHWVEIPIGVLSLK